MSVIISDLVAYAVFVIALAAGFDLYQKVAR